MGSPRKQGNVLGDLGAGFNRGLNDMGKGLKEVTSGRVDQGLSGIYTGYVNTMSYGLGEKIGMNGQTEQEEAAAQEEYGAAMDEKNLKESREQARKDAIRKQIDAEVAMRSGAPGRSQTLLTGMGQGGARSILPGANNTLLTTGKR